MVSTGFTTTILHADRRDDIEHGSLHKPVHHSVAFGYEDARDLAAVFQGKAGFSYGRQVNPTVAALEAKLTKMERGRASVAFSTGMGAIGTALFALLREGDHFISSSFLFGNTDSLFKTFAAHGVDVTFVDATDAANVEAAIQANTRLVFVETIANPRTQVSDLARIGALCRKHDLVYFVDNTLTTPYLFLPVEVDASLIINSLTKYISGHGNVLGGALTDTGLYDWSRFPNIHDYYKKGDPRTWGLLQIRKKGLRDFGAALSPDAADQIALGAETLALRMERACANARVLADFLRRHEAVKEVYYPGLRDHPQYDLTHDLFRHPGALLSFELRDDVDVFECMNRLDVVVLSSNLGDNRTLAIPVSHTIYYEMGPERRASMGIDESLVRVSVGIEDPEDLIGDFQQALEPVQSSRMAARGP
jgi:O-acetylhomoserine (thiol)-lyase